MALTTHDEKEATIVIDLLKLRMLTSQKVYWSGRVSIRRYDDDVGKIAEEGSILWFFLSSFLLCFVAVR